MCLGQSFYPGRDTGGYLSPACGPSSDKTIIAFERFSETALRPAQRGQAVPEAFGRHGPKNLMRAAVAPTSAAPAVIPAITSCQPESA